jgi:PncC family amidohydrolase
LCVCLHGPHPRRFEGAEQTRRSMLQAPKGRGQRSIYHVELAAMKTLKPRSAAGHSATSPEAQIGDLLRRRGLKLATAESCTGGLIADRLTDVPGSSEYFLGGIVAYAYEAKVALLNVSWKTLKAYGAVSRETVLEMARGARNALGADLAVSVSGIAGPGGGLPNKPVGTTWLGLSSGDGEQSDLLQFGGDRRQNKALAADAALSMLLEYLRRGAA